MVGDQLGLVVETVRHLKPRQLFNRITRRWVSAPRLREAPPLRAPGARLDGPPLAAPPSFLGGHRFRFLNEERHVPPPDFGSPKEGLLWDYNFHYFEGLRTPGSDPETAQGWIEDWLSNVPVGSRPAWDPYPTSRRILNWILWSASSGRALPTGGRDSLATQARHLERTLEFHLMANHLLANAVALAAAGAWFGGDEGDGWLRTGSALLRRELEEQFLDDGGHYELSPTYHALILGDLLQLVQIARATGCSELERTGLEPVHGALAWLAGMVRPDGRLPLFNDAAYDQAPEVGTLLDHAGRLLDGVPSPPGEGLELLGPSGYFRYRHDRLFLAGDVGELGPSYQPGHGHCDMLSFELCWDGRPVVVDTGTSTYEVGSERTRERGTAAHNTVQIGDAEQSEIWASFRVARRARVESVERLDDGVAARIRAFPPEWSRLERQWRFDGESVRIRDRVSQPGRARTATARLHLHPDVSVRGEGPRWQAGDLRIEFRGATAARCVESLYAPEFNVRVPTRCLEVDFEGELETELGP